jgi:putative transcriptional regulator
MTIRHHPDQALLLGHAAGALDPATALIVATHLSFCAHCRAEMAMAEQVGGVVLQDIAPVPVSETALATVLSRLDAPQAAATPPASNDGTPAPLRAFLGRDLSDVHWRRLGPRLGYVTLYRRGPLAMRLLRGAPGTAVGQHTHRGTELTLVLRGGYRDGTGRYGPGDFQSAGSDVVHDPVADPGEDCINLAVTCEGLHFSSALQRLAARLFGF